MPGSLIICPPFGVDAMREKIYTVAQPLVRFRTRIKVLFSKNILCIWFYGAMKSNFIISHFITSYTQFCLFWCTFV